MSETITSQETPEKVGPGLLDDSALPPAVLGVLCAGRAVLEARRKVEAEQREQEERRRAEEKAAAFAPVKDAVRAVVPPELHEFLDFREDDHHVHNLNYGNTYVAHLNAPGCAVILLQFSGHSEQGWQLYRGYWTSEWNESAGRAYSIKEPIPTLAEALALARECWLAEHRRDQDIPF